jgi:hypothetical protein
MFKITIEELFKQIPKDCMKSYSDQEIKAFLHLHGSSGDVSHNARIQ